MTILIQDILNQSVGVGDSGYSGISGYSGNAGVSGYSGAGGSVAGDVTVTSITQTGSITGTAVPKMTTNTTPSGVAAASLALYPAWKAFNRLYTTEDAWIGDFSIPCWLSYTFTAPTMIDTYTLTVSNIARAPTAWTFEGWNGSTWTVLDTQSGVTNWTLYVEKVYAFTNVASYTAYRVNITANNGDFYASINELKMYAAAGTLLTGFQATGVSGVRMQAEHIKVVGVVAYANNAAAIAAGLSVGDLYFGTTGDPRLLAVVI